ncbi:MAG: Exodeoxyribonuclease [Candidatus Heimdallarchaeota archaeon LC_2]|nr:MAG: Exodeoxyribonuclease [Candidatus Heimdallarchaeota archaeon LC_2]
MKYSIYSWNVNGIRASAKKGFVDWMLNTKMDILCVQETKAHVEQLDASLVKPKGYKSYWHSAEKKGYSGVSTYVKSTGKNKKIVNSVDTSIGVKKFDNEGRILITKFDEFTLLNVYFPNGKKNEERLDYKMQFYDRFLQFCQKLRKNGEQIVICGDVNTAHTEVDLQNHTNNAKYSGFLPIERAWIDKLIDSGYIDTYRYLNPEKYVKGVEKLRAYTWWSMRSKTARIEKVGWRLDYFIISEDLLENFKAAKIHADVEGSDHCPISIDLEF